MLSGLVLTPVFEPRFRAGLSAGRFIVQRIIRLWPVLAVGIVIGAAHGWAQGAPQTTLLLLTGLALIPMFTQAGAIYRLDGPQWSVGFELVANYAHVRLLARLSDRAVLGVALALGVVLAGLIAHFGTLGFGDITANWWGGFARVGFAYALGVWMGRMMIAGRGNGLSVPWWLAGLPLVAVLTLLPFVPLGRGLGDGLAVFGVLPVALWLAAHARVPVGAGARAGKVCAWLGALSYPIYTLHVPMLGIARQIAMGSPPADRLFIRLSAGVAVVLAAWLLAIGAARLSRRPV
jgi:peptidoglycan/LPS O-acetylase OafA/YrhL